MVNDEVILQAGELLRAGKLVVIPTETVYGLGANALDPEAVRGIFVAKGRPSTDPLIVHVSRQSQVRGLVREVSRSAEQLMEAFWPGPLTLIMNKSDQVPTDVTAGLDTVAVRMPDHQLARAVIDAAGVPVAAPSANRFGRVSPTTPEHVVAELSGRYDLLVDGGSCAHGVESTIVDTTTEPVRLLRPGSITVEQLEAVVGPIAVVHQMLDEATTAESPGQLIGHYSPQTPVVVVNVTPTELADVVQQAQSVISSTPGVAGSTANNAATNDANNDAIHAGADAADSTNSRAASQQLVALTLSSDPATAAQQLYGALREADAAAVDLIVAPRFEDTGLGHALNDRLFRAAHGDFITEVDSKLVVQALLQRLS